MSRSRYRQTVDGILLLDKPRGLSSNQALGRVRWLYRAKRAGHTGNLDPMATGLLPICFGHATKVAAYLLAADKTYLATCRLGQRTHTADADGEVVEEAPVPTLSNDVVESAMGPLRGEIRQIPPMVSALHHEGRRLYALAREGKAVPREPRRVTVHELALAQIAGDEVTFQVRCSKGTYVRTLAEDLAANLGTVGHLTGLRRLAVSPFQGERWQTLEDVERRAESGGLAELLLPADRALVHLPAVHLDEDPARRLCQGQRLKVPQASPPGNYRAYGPGDRFLGVVRQDDEGVLRPERMFTQGETRE